MHMESHFSPLCLSWLNPKRDFWAIKLDYTFGSFCLPGFQCWVQGNILLSFAPWNPHKGSGNIDWIKKNLKGGYHCHPPQFRQRQLACLVSALGLLFSKPNKYLWKQQSVQQALFIKDRKQSNIAFLCHNCDDKLGERGRNAQVLSVSFFEKQ